MLVLSTAAAPDRSLGELLDGCAARGLAGLELVEGHAHGIDASASPEEMEAARTQAAARGIPIVGFRVREARNALRPEAARLAAALEAPVLAAVDDRLADGVEPAVQHFEEHGARLLLVHGADPAAVRELRRRVDRAPGTLGLAWDVDPADDGFADAAPAVLDAAGAALAYIRLLGGGPEAAQHEGRGIGSLMARLALAGFRGAVALAPSARSTLPVWNLWLGRHGGWGCGSKAEDRSLVPVLDAARPGGRVHE